MGMMTTGTGTESATWYYVGSFGQLGPLRLSEIEELVDGGVVERDTYVWNPAMPSWLPASQVPQLASALGRRLPHMEPPPTPTGPARPTTPPATASPSFATPPSFSAGSLTPPRPVTSTASAAQLGAAYAAYTSPYGMVSDRSRTVAGILNLLLPGVGRLYLGYSALGVIQLLGTFLSCGLLYIWSVIDGVMMLIGNVKIDGYGRILKD